MSVVLRKPENGSVSAIAQISDVHADLAVCLSNLYLPSCFIFGAASIIKSDANKDLRTHNKLLMPSCGLNPLLGSWFTSGWLSRCQIPSGAPHGALRTAQLQSGVRQDLWPLCECSVSNTPRAHRLLSWVLSLQIEMAQKLLNSDLAELINKMKLAQQYVMTSLQQEYKKQMLTAAHALAVDAKNLLDVIDQARLKISQSRPH